MQKLTIFGPKFDPCGPLFLKIKILKAYCTYTNIMWQYYTEIKCMKEELMSHAEIGNF